MSTDRREFVESLKVNKKRNIKNKPAKMEFKRFIATVQGKVQQLVEKAKQNGGKIITSAALGVGYISMLVTGMTGCTNEIPQETSSMVINYNSWENKDNDTLVRMVKNDFLDKYVNEYNEEHQDNKVNRQNVQVKVHSTGNGILYEIDGKLVTTGSNPSKTREELSKLGEFSYDEGNDTLIQITAETPEGELIILGTYTPYGEFVYSANALEQLKDKSYTPIELDEQGKAGINVIRSSVQEDKNNTNKRAKKYLKDYYEEPNHDKDEEIEF